MRHLGALPWRPVLIWMTHRKETLLGVEHTVGLLSPAQPHSEQAEMQNITRMTLGRRVDPDGGSGAP